MAKDMGAAPRSSTAKVQSHLLVYYSLNHQLIFIMGLACLLFLFLLSKISFNQFLSINLRPN